MWMLTPSELRKSPTGRACSLDVGAGSADAAPGRSTGTPTKPTARAEATRRAARPALRLPDCWGAGRWAFGELGHDLAPAARDIDTTGDLFSAGGNSFRHGPVGGC